MVLKSMSGSSILDNLIIGKKTGKGSDKALLSLMNSMNDVLGKVNYGVNFGGAPRFHGLGDELNQ